jgi:hypothetical protein
MWTKSVDMKVASVEIVDASATQPSLPPPPSLSPNQPPLGGSAARLNTVSQRLPPHTDRRHGSPGLAACLQTLSLLLSLKTQAVLLRPVAASQRLCEKGRRS